MVYLSFVQENIQNWSSGFRNWQVSHMIQQGEWALDGCCTIFRTKKAPKDVREIRL